tara:strand:+ start:9248 stop:10156 length:909 start_codon:yes stop_codon:yes gene_type:complete
MQKILILFLAIFISEASWAKEELLIIQSVSNTKRTFVIRKGKAEGVLVHQESLFTNEKFSLSARAIEVTRDYSLWQISDTRATVPFQKGETVNYTNTIENLYTEIPLLRYDPKELAKEARERNRISQLRPEKWLLRGNLSFTLSESITETQASLESSRSGISFEAQRLWSFHPKMTAGFGIRYDQENTSLTEPNIDIPTTRILGIADFIYHFDQIGESRNHLYLGLGIGIGTSVTQVDEATSSGLATLLPSARLGYAMALSNGMSMVVETIAESISSSETFEDGQQQNTNLVNAKIAVGIKF